MKKLLLGLCIFYTLTISVSAQAFTGVVIFTTENFENGEQAEITCYISPPLCRMDIHSTAKEGSTAYSLFFDDNATEVIMIASGSRYSIPAATLKPNKYLENILVAVPSANTQQVAGYTAQEVTLKSTTAIIRCLVASGLSVSFPAMLNSRGIVGALKENSIQGIPMEIYVSDPNGKPLFTQKITAVTAEQLQPGLFTAN
jgi:hypothetical protein